MFNLINYLLNNKNNFFQVGSSKNYHDVLEELSAALHDSSSQNEAQFQNVLPSSSIPDDGQYQLEMALALSLSEEEDKIAKKKEEDSKTAIQEENDRLIALTLQENEDKSHISQGNNNFSGKKPPSPFVPKKQPFKPPHTQQTNNLNSITLPKSKPQPPPKQVSSSSKPSSTTQFPFNSLGKPQDANKSKSPFKPLGKQKVALRPPVALKSSTALKPKVALRPPVAPKPSKKLPDIPKPHSTSSKKLPPILNPSYPIIKKSKLVNSGLHHDVNRFLDNIKKLQLQSIIHENNLIKNNQIIKDMDILININTFLFSYHSKINSEFGNDQAKLWIQQITDNIINLKDKNDYENLKKYLTDCTTILIQKHNLIGTDFIPRYSIRRHVVNGGVCREQNRSVKNACFWISLSDYLKFQGINVSALSIMDKHGFPIDDYGDLTDASMPSHFSAIISFMREHRINIIIHSHISMLPNYMITFNSTSMLELAEQYKLQKPDMINETIHIMFNGGHFELIIQMLDRFTGEEYLLKPKDLLKRISKEQKMFIGHHNYLESLPV